jgi:hypothetical protein
MNEGKTILEKNFNSVSFTETIKIKQHLQINRAEGKDRYQFWCNPSTKNSTNFFLFFFFLQFSCF